MPTSRRQDLILTGLIFAGMFLAVLVGMGARHWPALELLIDGLAWTGVLFKQLLKLIIYPLVLASMVVGVVNLGDIRKVGGMALGGLAYFMLTTALAVVLGLVLVNVVEPGVGVSLALAGEVPEHLGEQSFGAFFLEMLKNSFKNPFQSLAQGDVLAILSFGLLLGAVTSTLGDEGKPVADFFRSLNAVMMRLTDWVMWLAPVGVFGLLAPMVLEQGAEALVALKRYVAVVILGLGTHGLVVLPALAWGLGGVPPWRFFAGVRKPLAVAFSTASSAATLPVSLEAARDMGLRQRIGGFVLPLGATVNMDGTALYEAMAVMFIAQVYGIELELGQQVLVFLTATLAAVGAAGIPGAGLITMTLVLTAVGLPIDGIGLILAVDRLLDMVRTTVNVSGDLTGAVVLDRLIPADEPDAGAAA